MTSNTTAKNPKIVAMVPVRMGSERLFQKNLSLIGGKLPVERVVEEAKKTGLFGEIYINSENPWFKKIADKLEVQFHLRPTALASSNTLTDDVIYNFYETYDCDLLAWINTSSPLQPSTDIRRAVEHFLETLPDSMITSYTEYSHTLFKGTPLNFSLTEKMQQTQLLTGVERLVYSVMAWRRAPYMRSFSGGRGALMNGKFTTCTVSRLSAMLLKTEEDYFLLDAIARQLSDNTTTRRVEYATT